MRNVPPHGQCIVIPGSEFDPDWEGLLDDGGYSCINTDLDGKPVTLVLMKSRDSGRGSEREVYTPPPKRKKDLPLGLSAMKGPIWSEGDEKRLLKRMGELKGSMESKCRQLEAEFSGRSKNSLLQKYKKLQRRPKAEGKKRGPKKKETIGSGPVHVQDEKPKSEVKKEQPGSGPGDSRVVIEVEKFVKHVLELMQRSFTFQWYCRTCKDSGSAEDEQVWKWCPKCGEELIVWNIEEESE
jgi:hypothetical protein